MKWNNKFNYPKSSRSIEDGMRKYLFREEKLPSVTSILQATKSEEDKASLELWKQRVGHVEANKIKNEASSRGTSMHSYIEDFLRGRINESFFESNEQYKNMAKEIIEKGIKGKLEEIYGMETTLHYPEKYAGTADLVGIYQGQEAIIDFKQANRPKKVDYILIMQKQYLTREKEMRPFVQSGQIVLVYKYPEKKSLNRRNVLLFKILH